MPITDEQITDMRHWVADCVWADVEEIAELDDAAILDSVSCNYDGGITAFIADQRRRP